MESQKILSDVFKLFSGTSVYNPFEVIIVMISICISLSILSNTTNVTKPDTELPKINIDPVSNFSFLMLLRCLAFICVLFQLKKLHKIHSKFNFFLSILITLVASIILNNALLSWFKFEISNSFILIVDIVIYTLLLIDVKKCNIIFNSAFEIKNLKEAKKSVAQNLASYASSSSLDTFCMILLIALGNLSESKEIKNFSIFGCLLLASNFLISLTIFPALLSLILQFKSTNENKCEKLEKSKSEIQLANNSTPLAALNSLKNPVLIYVKLLMTFFLIGVHLKLKFFNEKEFQTSSHSNSTNDKTEQNDFQGDAKDKLLLYTESCLLISLMIYIFSTKFIKRNDETDSECQTSVNQTSTSCQTEPVSVESDIVENTQVYQTRPTEECLKYMRENPARLLEDFNEEEIVELVLKKHIPIYKLESYFKKLERAVSIRRKVIEAKMNQEYTFKSLPYENYDYSKIIGSCCENVVGYVPVPLGIAGPLLIDGKYYQIPMATTEGTLVASTNRGCTALSSSQGVFTRVLSDGMTRAPLIEFPSAMRAADAKEWLDIHENFYTIKIAFESTSRFAKLESCKCCVVGKYLYIRFKSTTGDAMGMNMLSKGSEKALQELQKHFPDANIKSVSGNYCTDKKSSAINWIEGRGKSVVCEAVIKGDVVKSVLKTSVKDLVDLNLTKNLVGSAMAGSIGGFNAHAANIVTAVFIACGQDPAQVVESSNCLTWMECVDSEDLYISCTMPSIEVGTVGGGTILDAQSSCLKMLGVHGAHKNAGENASNLARIIASAVMAGELSLMSALASGHLVNSHMKYNRSTINLVSQAFSKTINNHL
ncbi:3-hydroxy-3-methylglutaryl-coenzyme A reductase [Brachionus plicatilis]|uniref:3-hydroxy-3-methylglutaryl coenzyme A reductase n=1 Tax=Brachionus plicatilis TaxID=10195 RepID=A0A3M7PGQ7_BRAPC|nr:3-hydroxy-3-methylglutaryl-coenzyme A reductase [Brachionus plicatilis]